MKGQWSAGKIVAVIFGSIGASVVLGISLYMGIFQMARGYLRIRADANEARAEYQPEENENGQDINQDINKEETDEGETAEDVEEDQPDESRDYPDKGSGKSGEEEQGNDSQGSVYYDIHDEIRRDLSYQIEFETYSNLPGGYDNIYVGITYPVVTGNAAEDFSGINNAIQKEIAEVEEYGESITEWLTRDEVFVFEAEGYVTYMDEDILSIIFMEDGYLNGDPYESYVISLNIDMKSGMVLNNSQLLDIDDEFSIDFRNRCEEQNGEINSLSMFSDQDITYLLTDDTSLIIFYTPLGMEVGFNYYYGWVTVTYQDYERYQSHF